MTDLIPDIYVFEQGKEEGYGVKFVLQQVALSSTGWRYCHPRGIFVKNKRKCRAPVPLFPCFSKHLIRVKRIFFFFFFEVQDLTADLTIGLPI